LTAEEREAWLALANLAMTLQAFIEDARLLMAEYRRALDPPTETKAKR